MICFILADQSMAQRHMEYLGRGLVTVKKADQGEFVSWRIPGTDPEGIAFKVCRLTGDAESLLLNEEPKPDKSIITF